MRYVHVAPLWLFLAGRDELTIRLRAGARSRKEELSLVPDPHFCDALEVPHHDSQYRRRHYDPTQLPLHGEFHSRQQRRAN